MFKENIQIRLVDYTSQYFLKYEDFIILPSTCPKIMEMK